MSERIEVASTDEFETIDRKIVEVRGTEIGIVHLDGDYYGILNTCPHQHGPVAEGEIQQPIVADVPDCGERVDQEYDDETTVIRCPLHQWGFDIETGENIADTSGHRDLVTYDVVVSDGIVYLEL
jgi:3-phenylpropionate/trans-cinnamate dioxygenase ferredoxin subunit